MKRHGSSVRQLYTLPHEGAAKIAELFATTTPAFPGARCVEHDDPDLWFATDEVEQMHAAILCGGCIHRHECFTFAADNGITDGTWGGIDERRRQLWIRGLA